MDAPIEGVGGARLRRPGSDALIVSWGRMVNEAEAAADELAETGIDAAVLDLRWLSPLDDRDADRAVANLRRVLVVHEANLTGGFGGEVAARVAEHAFERARRSGDAAGDTRRPNAGITGTAERAPSVPQHDRGRRSTARQGIGQG